MKYINLIVRLILVLGIIIIHIAVTYSAIFYRIPTFQALSFTEFGTYRYRCNAVSQGKGITAYEFEIEHNGKIYRPLYTIPTQQKCYEQLAQLRQKHIKIWYTTMYIDYIFNNKDSDVSNFEIYQLEADDKIIISYQEMLRIKKGNRMGLRIFTIMLYFFDIYLSWKKKERDRIKVNNDFRRYGL